MPINGRLHYYCFPLSVLRLNLPGVDDVDDLEKSAPEDLLIANLCITISNLSLDDPLLPYEDLKLRMPNIDVDYLMGLPASEEAEKASYIHEIMDEFGPGFVHVSETKDIVMDSACNLIDFYDDVDVFMPMKDVRVSLSGCSGYEDGFTPNEGAFMYAKDLDLDPDPMVVDTQGPVLALPERSFARLQEFELMLDVMPRLLKSILAHLVSSSLHFTHFNPDELFMNKELVLLVKLSRTLVMSHMTNQLFRGCDLFPSSLRTRPPSACLLNLPGLRLP